MLTSVAMTMLRMIFVAAILSTLEFSGYAAIVSAGAFVSILLSFGVIEGTIKQFPRMGAIKQYDIILKESLSLVKVLSARSFYLLVVFIISIFVLFKVPGDYIAIILIGYIGAITSLFASLQRALFNPLHLAFSSFLRTLVMFVFVVISGLLYGYYGALIAEVVVGLMAMFIPWIIANYTIKNKARTEECLLVGNNYSSIISEHGIVLFFTYLILSIPIYLDRMYVNTFYDSDSSATYSVIAIFLSISIVLPNIISQKLGPVLIKMQTQLTSSEVITHKALRWSVLTISIWILIITTIGLGFQSGYLPASLEKYRISIDMLFAIGVLGCMNIAAFFEFIVISYNYEKQFLYIALGYILLIIFIASFAIILSMPIYTLIIMIAFVKFIYLSTLISVSYYPNVFKLN